MDGNGPGNAISQKIYFHKEGKEFAAKRMEGQPGHHQHHHHHHFHHHYPPPPHRHHNDDEGDDDDDDDDIFYGEVCVCVSAKLIFSEPSRAQKSLLQGWMVGRLEGRGRPPPPKKLPPTHPPLRFKTPKTEKSKIS